MLIRIKCCLNLEKAWLSWCSRQARTRGGFVFTVVAFFSFFQNSDAFDVQYMTFRHISEQFRIFLKLYTLLIIIVDLAVFLVLYNISLQLVYCIHNSLYMY